MRTLLLWFPLTVILNLAAVASVIFTAVVYPTYLFGWRGYGTTILVAAAIVAAVMVVVYCTLHIIAYRERRKMERDCNPNPDPTPRFVTAVRLWARKAHDGICPGIIIELGMETK